MTAYGEVVKACFNVLLAFIWRG